MYRLTITLAFLCATLSLAAQAGYSSTAMSRSQQLSALGIHLSPQDVVIEEYLNYHRHNLPLPTASENVHLDLRWGNDQSSGPATLQIGLTTQPIANMSQSKPINLALVIDRSGSMSGDKMVRTREAMLALIDQLRPDDIVSLVWFDHEVWVPAAAQRVGNGQLLRQHVRALEARGSTDLHGGILQGYRELLGSYDADYAHRMLILTDAITNTGVVDPEQIARDANLYHPETPVDFTMICVGAGFNQELARAVTQNGHNTIHFIHNATDIQKVFVDEVGSILAPIARDVRLRLQIPDGLSLTQFYGYSPIHQGDYLTLHLNQINADLTQVVLTDWQLAAGSDIDISVELSYYDLILQREVTQLKTLSLQHQSRPVDPLENPEVRKNTAIGRMALALQDFAYMIEAQQHARGQRVLRNALNVVDQQVGGRSGYALDKDVQHMRDILQRYTDRMSQWISERDAVSQSN